MRFIKGLVIGLVLGFAAGSAISERQREELKARLIEQTRPVRDAASSNISRVAGTVTDEAAAVIDHAGEQAANAVEGSVSAPGAP